MTDPRVIVEHAKRTGKLKLSFGETLKFYWTGILFAVMFFDILFTVISGYYFFEEEAVLFINFISFAVFLIIYITRRKTLKFTVIETGLPKGRLLSLIKEVTEHYDWEVKVANQDIIVVDYLKYVDRSFDPPLDIARHPGERITIVFDDNKVLINSILNMERFSNRGEPGSRRSNLENIDIIREEIQNEEEYYK